LYIDGIPRQKGLIGSLEFDQWGWGQYGSEIGADSVYVRILGGVNPSTVEDQTYIEYSTEGEPAVPVQNNENITTFEWASTSSGDYITAHIPLSADTVVGNEDILMDLTFLSANWTLDAVSTWMAAIIWEEPGT
jgi:hypothetical protein